MTYCFNCYTLFFFWFFFFFFFEFFVSSFVPFASSSVDVSLYDSFTGRVIPPTREITVSNLLLYF